jgi:uncharacterized protein YndB with AHSA1/START domain
MAEKFSMKAEIVIKATPAKVWEALTKPELIKQYFFGVDVVTDWKVGSPIIYRGMWQEKPFEDKGAVLAVDPGRFMHTNYWSSFSGVPDAPENYQNVIYVIAPEGDDAARLTVTQDNIPTEEAKKHSEENWKTVLEGMKKLLEK